MQGSFKAVLAIGAAIAATNAGLADELKVGFLGGMTGPIESLMPPILAGARLAVDQVNEAGGISGKNPIKLVVGDTTCADATKAADAADRAVNVENVVAIVGAMCSGATISAAHNAAIPGGIVMVSPASTSPAVTTLEDKDLVFRTTPSDAFQGQVLANVVKSKGIDQVAVTYVNNDYGKGFAGSFQEAFEKTGGKVLASEAHEDGKADYRAEIGSLASTGAPALVVLAYIDGSGGTIVKQAIEGGDFSQFIGGDGMVGDRIGELAGEQADGMIATRPGAPELPGTEIFGRAAKETGFDPQATFASQSYDAAFLLALALEKTGGKAEGLNEALREVATQPGETILPGEWEKAAELIKEGKEINYEGASGSHEFDENGDVPGVFDEMVVKSGKFERVGPAKTESQ
ncbi:branched-chain amino acid ABC transporter substrate-binding protein [Mesorhizobium sp. L-8-10]|uniref:ABC transporter substrate-binding protein n=1 Tax=Mesorhizobium sp. L-8-10 TaxID=2744523 RepID=UPI0019257CBD|nr:ABC transporter substrate-binding protein [Mesorhizobium sp. L-8-10]BCH29999.1 branched-chain amino acid ABC transporter substrate-binding protein [Mesorhizobium sp. L-8-10]